MILLRSEALAQVERALRDNPVVALLGPRQCGKSTLARDIASARKQATFFDLESPADLGALSNPVNALSSLRGLIILDEVQRRPDLFPVLRVLADRKPSPARFLVLGSASPELLRQSSESLAGRIAFVELSGFTLAEVGSIRLDRLWQRGGFPRSFLAKSELTSAAWRNNFVRTFVERDLRLLDFDLPSPAMHRFWTMLAHFHGQTWNASALGRSLGVSDHTTRRYLDALSGALFVRQLLPWFENVGKRQTKAPKIYLRDSGIFHSLMGIPDRRALLSHPALGASWEGFALEQILSRYPTRDAYFWGTHAGAELDLLLFLEGRRVGVELKFADAPTTTKSMRVALADLRLDKLWVVHPGDARYVLDERIEAIGLAEFTQADR